MYYYSEPLRRRPHCSAHVYTWPAAMSTLEDLAADIADMEALLARAERPKVRAIICDHLDHLRKEQALRTHSAQFTGVPAANPVSAPKSSTASTSVPAIRSPAPAPAPPRAPASAPPRAPAPAPPPAPPPVRLPTTSGGGGAVVTYTTISSFGWDQDSYGKEPNFIYVYITSGVDGVGDVKDSVVCDFNKSSFDLKIIGLGGKNFRLYKNQLDKEIVPTESKVVVKKNRLTIKMKKVVCWRILARPYSTHIAHPCIAVFAIHCPAERCERLPAVVRAERASTRLGPIVSNDGVSAAPAAVWGPRR